MYRTIFKREFLFLVVLVLFSLIVLSGCELLGVGVESWTHVVIAENYTDADAGGYYVYRINDDRFNTNDWYDIWMDNSFWDSASGWGPFDSVYDSGARRFYYQPLYYDGYVEWNAYGNTETTDIVGATLRFYRHK